MAISFKSTAERQSRIAEYLHRFHKARHALDRDPTKYSEAYHHLSMFLFAEQKRRARGEGKVIPDKWYFLECWGMWEQYGEDVFYEMYEEGKLA